jgi:hypothetical protein
MDCFKRKGRIYPAKPCGRAIDKAVSQWGMARPERRHIAGLDHPDRLSRQHAGVPVLLR